MPETIYEKIQALIEQEIIEREHAASLWDATAVALEHGGAQANAHADACKAQAMARQNQAECFRLNRKKLEMELEAKELIH